MFWPIYGHHIHIGIGISMLVFTTERVGFTMLDFTWKVFKETGSIDTYLLFKELEKDNVDVPEQAEELANSDLPIS
jgi:hypothetical protein